MRDQMQAINDAGRAPQRVKWGGQTYRNTDGTYGFTIGTDGSPDSVDVFGPDYDPMIEGAETIGGWHYQPPKDSDQFNFSQAVAGHSGAPGIESAFSTQEGDVAAAYQQQTLFGREGAFLDLVTANGQVSTVSEISPGSVTLRYVVRATGTQPPGGQVNNNMNSTVPVLNATPRIVVPANRR